MHSMTYRRVRRFALAAAAALISGCSAVGTVLQEQYDMAQNVTTGCRTVNDTFILPSTQTVEAELIGRLRTKLTSAFCSSQGQPEPGTNCAAPDQDSLKSRFTADVKNLVDHIDSLASGVKPQTDRIRASIQKIDSDLNMIDQLIDKAKANLKSVSDTACVSKTVCAQLILSDLSGNITPLRANYVDIEKELGAISFNVIAIRNAINDTHPDIADELDATVVVGRQVIQTAYQVIDAFITKDAPAVGEHLLVVKIDYAAADQTLHLIEDGLRPADRLLDKGDDKLFFLPTIIITWQSSSIQDAMDNLYNKLVQPGRSPQGSDPGEEPGPLNHIDLRWAFAKASCNRLTEASTESSSQLMPFVERMFLFNLFPEDSPKARKNVDPGSMRATVLAKHKAAVQDARQTGTKFFTQSELFQTCYVTHLTSSAAKKTKNLSGTGTDEIITGAQACGAIASAVRTPGQLKTSLTRQRSSATINAQTADALLKAETAVDNVDKPHGHHLKSLTSWSVARSVVYAH